MGARETNSQGTPGRDKESTRNSTTGETVLDSSDALPSRPFDSHLHLSSSPRIDFSSVHYPIYSERFVLALYLYWAWCLSALDFVTTIMIFYGLLLLYFTLLFFTLVAHVRMRFIFNASHVATSVLLSHFTSLHFTIHSRHFNAFYSYPPRILYSVPRFAVTSG